MTATLRKAKKAPAPDAPPAPPQPAFVIAIVARAAVLLAAIIIPFRILGHGFLPLDDALRHVGKIVSGKEWAELMVVRADMPMDSHPGWHAFLGFVHQVTGWDAHGLLVFSVVGLFAAVSIPAVLLLRRPEAWMLSLVVLAVAENRLLGRLLMGRPFLVTLAAYLAVVLLLPRLSEGEKPPRTVMGLIVGAIAIAVWMHPVWYLWSVPVLACVLARSWSTASRLAGCTALGIVLGCCLTGHPFDFLFQTFEHGALTVDLDAPAAALTQELRPQTGSISFLLVLFAVLATNALRGRFSRALLDTPAFWLVVFGWVMGWVSLRFWSEFGLPAALVVMAMQLEDVIAEYWPEGEWSRLVPVGAACLAGILVWSANVEGRWRNHASRFDILYSEEAQQSGVLPEPGGILYSDQMEPFFQGIYRAPRAPWRYMVGFEPALMPPEDRTIYNRILDARPHRPPGYFEPWISRMRPGDRMILESQSAGGPPQLDGLQWQFVPPTFWIGRVVPPGAAPADAPQ
jgi:hypothetical protein